MGHRIRPIAYQGNLTALNVAIYFIIERRIYEKMSTLSKTNSR